MKVRAILVEGKDGEEDLLGFERQVNGWLTGPPALSRRGPDGAFQVFDDVQAASKVAMAQLGPPRARI